MSTAAPQFIPNVTGVSKPVGYSMAVVAPASSIVYVSGQVSLDEKGQLVGANDFAKQVEQSFSNLKRVLFAAGCGFEHVIKFNYYVVGLVPERLAIVRNFRDTVLSDPRPASTLVGVSALATPDLLFEVEVVAARP
jgi:enamine deaminase RidA (YjgF/YER057c/UK114 family)